MNHFLNKVSDWVIGDCLSKTDSHFEKVKIRTGYSFIMVAIVACIIVGVFSFFIDLNLLMGVCFFQIGANSLSIYFLRKQQNYSKAVSVFIGVALINISLLTLFDKHLIGLVYISFFLSFLPYAYLILEKKKLIFFAVVISITVTVVYSLFYLKEDIVIAQNYDFSVYVLIAILLLASLVYIVNFMNVFTSERKYAEETIREKIQDLESANKALDSFSYSVSHDLHTPLRAIARCTQILNDKHAATMDAEDKELFDYVLDGAKRMNELIDNLLEFSRMSKVEMTKSQVDMSMLVKEVLDDLIPQEKNRAIELKIAPLGKVASADAKMLSQVWINLIANALKYSQKKEKTIIEIGVSHSDGEFVYSIKDNGVGFDMRYAHKLFKPFNRLHNEDEFTGTGVGLALVKQIVSRHDGRVWAESEIDKGATFYFSLPV